MPLPSSGPLSIADIRNEGVTGGCYSAGSSYSLGSLATAFGIPTDPDSISEFYGRSCPTTTTSTTTTTTTVLYSVNIYTKFNASSPISGEAYLYTSNNGGSYTSRTFINSSTCTLYSGAQFSVPAGTVLYLGVTDSIGDAISFNATTGTTCPLNEANFCFGDYSVTINGNTNLAVNVFMTKAREYNYCGIPAPN
jgi:hypothetical protein